MTTTRRKLVAAALLAPAALHAAPKKQEKDEEVTPAEDLMREHGVLRRALLVYDEVGRRLDAGGPVPSEPLGATARLIQKFIEGYHEKIEEQHVFPVFEKAGKLVELTHTLRAQHEAGRAWTQQILQGVGSPGPALREPLRLFVRMYAPHAAREDTDLFPGFRGLVGAKRYQQLGDQFEDLETQMVGHGGFEKAVQEIAQIEQQLGIGDLARFTHK